MEGVIIVQWPDIDDCQGPLIIDGGCYIYKWPDIDACQGPLIIDGGCYTCTMA